MNRAERALEHGVLPRNIVKEFAGVRGRVRRAVAATRQPVSYDEALKQAQRFLNDPTIPSK